MFRNSAESWKLFVSSVLLICCLSSASWADAPMPIPRVTFDHLTCEYLDNPEGIDTTSPRLSWEEKSLSKSYIQSSYRIIVASSPALLRAGKGDLWDTGKVNSPRTLLCSYAGIPLKSRRRCWWAVRAWDGRGHLSAWNDCLELDSKWEERHSEHHDPGKYDRNGDNPGWNCPRNRIREMGAEVTDEKCPELEISRRKAEIH